MRDCFKYLVDRPDRVINNHSECGQGKRRESAVLG